MNIFEQASRQGFRFNSARGLLTVEQLWTLPLTSTQGFDLDTIAKDVYRQIKAGEEESFVNPTKNIAQEELGVHLEIVKYIISVKLAEAQAARDRVKTKEQLEKVLVRLAAKNDAALDDLPVEELEKIAKDLKAAL